MKPGAGNWIGPGLLAVLTFAADFFSKAWANANLLIGNSQIFLPGLLRFTLTRNTGGAFGVGRGQGVLMTFLAVFIVSGIIIWFWKREHSLDPPRNAERYGVALIVGGALGNLFDRLTRGEVTDFLEFSFMNFPVFNVADALIDVGAFLVVLAAITAKKVQEPALASDGAESVQDQQSP